MAEVLGAPQSTQPTTSDRILRFASFEVDVGAGELRRGGLKIKLHGQPFDVLLALLRKPGQVVTREELRETLWSHDTFVDFEHGLNKAINKIREALGDDADNPRFIETVPRRGYRFLVPVTLPAPEPQKRAQITKDVKLTSRPNSGEAATQPLVGKTLGHYRVAEMVGSGGMGNVYRAHDQHLDREVAIKVLNPGTLADEHARKRFRKEALALSKLNHPNIATAHDFDAEGGVDFLVLEYIPGVTLSVKLAARALTETEVIDLGTQLAEGLSAAHEHGVIHGDLKPANLLVMADERLKILDFGLARLRGPVISDATTQSLTEAHPWGGTLSYMAPEQLLGGEIDARTDIYSAGCVLYEMATGQKPFAEVDRSQLIGAVLRGWQLSAGVLKHRVSPDLQRIIAKCLEKEPDKRYQSAEELAIDLQHLSSGVCLVPGGTLTPGGVSKRRAETRLRKALRSRILTIAVATLFLVAISILVYLLMNHVSPASIAVLPFADLSPGHDQEYFSDGLAEELLAQLSKVPNLRVVARTSAFQFKGKKKLNAANVLEGSVRKEGDRLRITAELTQTDDGFHLWSDSYDRDLKDILALQNEIALAVSSALQLKLLGHTSVVRVVNPEAYQAFLQARYFSHMNDEESSRKALNYVTKAIQADPSYAPAYALRGSIELEAGGMTWINLSEATQGARRDTENAIALDPNLADGYRVLSAIQSEVDSNCREAEVSLRRARELAPGDADILGQNAFVEMCQGHVNEAVELWKKALLIDPLRPEQYLWLAQGLRDLGRYEEAHAALRKALDLNPNSISMIHEVDGEIYLAEGRADIALAEAEKEPQDLFRDLGEALAFFALGRGKESDTALSRMITRHANDGAYQIAQVYAYRGELDEAFMWLERAYRQHDPGLQWFKTDLKLNSLRKDPRYTQLLTKLNLSD